MIVNAYGTKRFRGVPIHEYPNRLFLEQVDGEHRHQNGETVDYAQYYQFVLDGHDTKISEEKSRKNATKGIIKGVNMPDMIRELTSSGLFFLPTAIVSVISLASI